MVSQTLDFTSMVEKLLNVEQFCHEINEIKTKILGKFRCVVMKRRVAKEDIVTHIPTNNIYIFIHPYYYLLFFRYGFRFRLVLGWFLGFWRNLRFQLFKYSSKRF